MIENVLLSIPLELLLQTASFLDIGSLFSFRMVCRSLRKNLNLKKDMMSIRINVIFNQHTCLFKWLVPDPLKIFKIYWPITHCEKAAIYGSFDILKYLWPSIRQNIQNARVLINAVKGGHFEIVKWLRKNGCEFSTKACKHAIKYGHLEILKWLCENRCPWNIEEFYYAARNGHWDILKWHYENKFPWDTRMCSNAARTGRLDVLKWLHEKGCPWNEHSFNTAPEMTTRRISQYRYDGGDTSNYLKILTYLRDNGCPMDYVACSYAAATGHFDVLKWLHENGCPWNKDTCVIIAGAEGHHKILEYLHGEQY